MKNINSRALALAHNIKGAYSTYRLALLAAYKALRSSLDKTLIMSGLVLASRSLDKLGLFDKSRKIASAWLALYNLDYLD
jgi:hypothetical protein